MSPGGQNCPWLRITALDLEIVTNNLQNLSKIQEIVIVIKRFLCASYSVKYFTHIISFNFHITHVKKLQSHSQSLAELRMELVPCGSQPWTENHRSGPSAPGAGHRNQHIA